MEPPIARAFLMRLLNSVQIDALRNLERSLPPGRYSMGFEICREYGLAPKPITEQQEMQMKALWNKYEGILWKQRQIEDKNHEKVCGTSNVGWCQCKTYQEELHQWEDYALQNYKDATMEALSY